MMAISGPGPKPCWLLPALADAIASSGLLVRHLGLRSPAVGHFGPSDACELDVFACELEAFCFCETSY